MSKKPSRNIGKEILGGIRQLKRGEIGRVIPVPSISKGLMLAGLAQSEEGAFDYQLENDPRFLARIESARQSLRQGRGVKIEDIEMEGFSRRKRGRRSS